jgi:hypothetical protein
MQLPRIRGCLLTVSAWSPHLTTVVSLTPLLQSSSTNRRMHRQRSMRPELAIMLKCQPVSSQPLSLFGCPFEIVHDCTFILLPSRAMLSDRIVPFLRSPVSRVAIPARCFPRHLNVRGLRTLPSFSLEGKTCVGIQH